MKEIAKMLLNLYLKQKRDVEFPKELDDDSSKFLSSLSKEQFKLFDEYENWCLFYGESQKIDLLAFFLESFVLDE